MVWISEECWLACDEGDLIQWTQSGDSSEDIQEKARYIHREGNCYMIFPSWFYRALTERQGWEWFDPIRETPRFQAYAARISRLIVQKKRKI
jgi:hypothetical protein